MGHSRERFWRDVSPLLRARGKADITPAFETLRIYRPRMLIHGEPHMGQRLLGSALLHHLEGYHVQSLDIGNLLGNSDGVSTRCCVEAVG